MPRQKTLITIIREIVDQEVRKVFASLLGTSAPAGKKAKKRATNGRRKRKAAANGRKRRGPGRPPGKKKRARKASPAGA